MMLMMMMSSYKILDTKEMLKLCVTDLMISTCRVCKCGTSSSQKATLLAR